MDFDTSRIFPKYIKSILQRPLDDDVQEEINALLRRSDKVKEKEKEKQVRRWTFLEDLKLKGLVAISGPRNWTQIEKKMHGRTAKTCRSRWFNHLDPRINDDAFSDEENKKLLEAHKELGSKWSKIARRFNGRTDRAVHNQWDKLMKQKLKKPSPPHQKTNDLIDSVLGFTDSVRDENTKINNSSLKIPQEETTNYLRSKHLTEAMEYSARHHHFSYLIPTVSLEMFTPHVPISQPSSSSLPSKAKDTKAKIPPKFIDFLGVGDS
ncbi:PREDICTED: transcription factor WER-like [Camelina sativa]|uniref:Transcription factor WER-like n=1 Tax=Camelina sativa TaxID=90675 RepID=A0ABM0V6T3_CAMSA|nr:PREDICTED: transcription factor WER-like [Camelina sativa]